MGLKGNMTAILVTCPSYKGISDAEIRERVDASGLERLGYAVSVACVRSGGLDVSRNELMTVARLALIPFVFMLDDDVSIEALGLDAMVRAETDICSAPYKMRTDGNMYDVALMGEPFDRNGVRLMECAWTGLGAVLVRHEVLASMHSASAHLDLHYQSLAVPGETSCGLFNSMIVPMRRIDPTAGQGAWHFSDDRAFSLRVREAGYKIHVAPDVRTNHRGLGWSSLGADMVQGSAR